MPIEKPVARIGGEPRREEGAGRVWVAALVPPCAKPCAPCALFGFAAIDCSIFARAAASCPSSDSHGMIGEKPKIVTVMWGEAVHQYRDLVLLSDVAGAADQAVGVRATGDDQRVAR